MSDHPEDPFHRIQREVERLFHGLVYQRHPSAHFGEPLWAPPADLMVSDDSARVILELAGVPRQNVRVRLKGKFLEISGRRDPPREIGDAIYHRAEIFFGEFRRLIELPWDADDARVDARYREGLLEIHLYPAPSATLTQVQVEQLGAE